MAGLSKIEAYLMDLGIRYQETEPETFVIDDQDKGLPGVIVSVDEPIVIIRAKVMDLPSDAPPEFFKRLLSLNATDMVHGAYGLDGGDIVLLDTLEYGTMDKAEFEASLDSISLALSRHYVVLGAFRD